MSAAGLREEWSYFKTRWGDYVEATKITGKDKVIQLLECCDDKNQNTTLEEVFQFIEAKKAGKRSADHLIDSQGLNAARSSYRRAKSEDTKLPRRQDHMNEKCIYCGKQGHGKAASPRIRKNECPACEKKCDASGRPNHFENVCRSKDKPKLSKTSEQDAENTILDALDHHIYNELNDCWIKQPSKLQPFIHYLNRCMPARRLHSLGFKPTIKRSKEIEVSAIADTGCQSCLASMKIIERLGLQKNDLIPVTMRMHAASNNGIKILGAVIMRFTGRSKTGKNWKAVKSFTLPVTPTNFS